MLLRDEQLHRLAVCLSLSSTSRGAFNASEAISLELLVELTLCRLWVGDQELLEGRIGDLAAVAVVEWRADQDQVELVIRQPGAEPIAHVTQLLLLPGGQVVSRHR